jgi:starch phosphorylase
MFGYLSDQVEAVRYNNSYNPLPLEQRSPELAAVFKCIESGAFGDGGIYGPLLKTVITALLRRVSRLMRYA